MKLKKLSLNSFKTFKKVEIEFGKITLLTGPNSSGKSSLLAALLGTLQSDDFPFSFSPNGKYLQLGDFDEIINDHSNDRRFGISLSFEDSNNKISKIDCNFQKNSKTKAPMLNSLSFSKETISLHVNKTSTSTYRAQFELFPNSLKSALNKDFFSGMSKIFKHVETFSAIGPGKKTAKKTKLDNFIEEAEELVKLDVVKGAFSFKTSSDFYKEVNKHLLLSMLGSDVVKQGKNFDKMFNYIGPFRTSPERTYYQKQLSDLKVDSHGEKYIDQILNWKATGNNKLKVLKKILSELNLLDDITTGDLKGGRFELKVKNSNSKKHHSLADVGFGISQFLPILVADLQLENNSTLAVAQPEIHLHPSAQADYISYLSDRCIKDNISYIIETHSEYILNRVRLLIAEGKIREEDVKVYYLDPRKESVEVMPLRFTKEGVIENAPESFFDTYLSDSMKIAYESTKSD